VDRVTPNIRRSESRRLDGPLTDAATHWDDRRFDPDASLVLAKITAATAIAGAWARWKYEAEEAIINAGPLWTTSTRAQGRAFPDCFSVSELSNTPPTTSISYGVSSANLLGSFGPVRIPDGTFVAMCPHRISTGALVYLIINTQAIDGTCTGPGGGAGISVNPGG
jgi:hypothetical protein